MNNTKIPKVINYCWFGGNKKNKVAEKCIQSWKKNCPDYEFIEWNENNFDVNMNNYVKQAYENKKWAFVSDFARLWILYNYGGIYFDVDVELLKPIDDLLNYSCFLASEDNIYINTGLGCAAEKGNILFKQMLDDYNDINFIKDDGSMDLTTCVIRNSKSIENNFLNKIADKNTPTVINNNAYFTKEYFCPYNYINGELTITKNTYSIHWFKASWLPKRTKFKISLIRTMKKIFGEELYNKIFGKFVK